MRKNPRFPAPLRAWSAGLLGLALLTSCAKVPVVGKSSDITIKAAADTNCNSCGNPNGNPLTVRVLQVTDAASVAGLSLIQLWDNEDARLGGGLVEKKEFTIEPGVEKTLTTPRQEKATAVIVVANYCRPERRCWQLARTLPQGGGGVSFKVRAAQTCLIEPK